MALKQPVSTFQIRNPYRLERPAFDSAEVWQAAITDEEQAIHTNLSQRPLPRQLKESRQYGAKKNKQNSESNGSSTENNNPYQSSHEVQQQPSQPSIPTITVTHHIDTYSELTFERHVEWLTQTALWWDMPVVHLYPAPESRSSLKYVEAAASRFSNWVNFVKIPISEETQLGSATFLAKSSQASRGKSQRVIKDSKVDSAQSDTARRDGNQEGGLVKSALGQRELKDVKLIVGYTFVGSVEEQAQYHNVFEAMTKLYPMIEIRYINSFEPQHLQSRQQQELLEDVYLQNLSWIHYWSAAKESQVLQSKIVNEVVRARPMWVNGDLLHRNYLPPVVPTTPSPILDHPMSSLSSSALAISPSPSVYVGSNEGDGYSIEESLRGIPSTVLIASHLDTSSISDEPKQTDISSHDRRHFALECQYDNVQDTGCLERLPSRVLLNRTQSPVDVHRDAKNSIRPFNRSKKWGFPSLVGGGVKDREYRRSVSTPLLLLTRDNYSSGAIAKSKESFKGIEIVGSNIRGDTNMSPPPTSSPPSSPTSTSSTASSSSSSSMGSLGIGHRLAGLAHRFGMYKIKGSSLMTVDL
ncbi:hypothetical protein BX616_009864 [Lobosporangium transversale]|uniref:Uncharacterized protein n=1 Tax=Lobosporangium transversale TaxID=64571 RepID=A0A1Y2GXX6_9FUNG|nr:hypothetical protein BCR41DRAFT_413501 [Lobosporangium transversale]KAF9913574.1 hypothetical protein BX616_009864 [Lobosporangium transversale]ORZ27105.1 hypothetical protein BCR41DRAFT_413501 [Lobosporangium transversale]|eukprot:XP_021884852.1 hypothetical protein BCR41DRAFT_413501 [Lobosporangium transversale]